MFEDQIQKLKTRLGRIEANRRSLLETVEREQRDGLTEDERRKFDEFSTEIAETEARIAELESDEARMATARAAGARLGIYGDSARVTSEPLTYTADGQHSYMRDSIRATVQNDPEARERLARHANEVARAPEFDKLREVRALDRTDTSSFVPPAWLMNQWIEFARPGRPVANLIRSQAVPAGTSSLNIPRVKSGTSTGIQAADGDVIANTDMQTDSITLGVHTIAGGQTLSLQLLDQSPLNFDEIVFRDLLADYAVQLDKQVLQGTGSANGQVTGFLVQTGTTSVTAKASGTGSTNTGLDVYSAIANVVQKIHTTRFQSPTVIAMSPARWSWFSIQTDSAGRPLVTPRARTTSVNSFGSFDVAAQGPAGDVLGLPVVLDPNLGSSGTEPILVLRPEDALLYESSIRTRVLPEVNAKTLQIECQAYGYVAFSAGRYPQSTGIVTGLTAPSW